MKIQTMSSALETAIFGAFLIASNASPQMPTRPGKLHITSTPPAQTITINDALRAEVTPVTLVVSPGTYKVKIQQCAEHAYTVSSGQTQEIQCP